MNISILYNGNPKNLPITSCCLNSLFILDKCIPLWRHFSSGVDHNVTSLCSFLKFASVAAAYTQVNNDIFSVSTAFSWLVFHSYDLLKAKTWSVPPPILSPACSFEGCLLDPTFGYLSVAWDFNHPNLAFEFLPYHSTTLHCLSFICSNCQTYASIYIKITPSSAAFLFIPYACPHTTISLELL